jgi:hypothetical protein
VKTAPDRRTPAEPLRVAALNMGPTVGWDAYQPYINLVKGTIDNWSQPFVDGNGEVQALPPGRTIAMNVWYGFGGTYQKVKTGRYVVKWSGGAATLTIVCAGASIGAQEGNRRTFELQQVSDQTSGQLKLAFSNETKAPIDIRGLVVCHASHEGLLDAGEIFNPDWIAACGPRLACVRTMKPMAIENSVVTSPAQLKRAASQSWCANEDASTGGMPYTVAARLAAKLGCDLHAPVPIRGTQALYDEIARQIAGVAEFTGVVDAEVGNENWNGSYNARDWLGNVFGKSQSPSLDAPQAEAQKALMWFNALAKALPRERIRRVLCGQVADGFSPGGWFDRAMRHVDREGLVERGAPLHAIVDELRVGLYVTPATTTAVDGSGELFHARLKNIDWKRQSDAAIDSLFANGQAIAEGRLATFLRYAAALRPGLSCSSYEWGQGCIASVTGWAGTTYLGSVSSSDNTFVWHASTPASFSDGDAWLLFGDAFPVRGYQRGTFVYAKAKDAKRAWLFASDAARRADTSDIGAGAIVLDAAAPGRLFAADNFSRAQDFGTRIKAYLDGPAGGAMYERFFAATVGAGKLRAASHLYDFAGYGQGAYVTMWGLKSGVYAVDTPRYRWWRAL